MNPEIRTLIKKYKGDGVAYGLEKSEQVVQEYVYNPNIHENQYSALVSFCDNVGAAAFIMSDVLRYVNEGSATHFKLAAENMMEWTGWGESTNPPISASMRKRREVEVRIFKTPCLVAHNVKPKKRA